MITRVVINLGDYRYMTYNDDDDYRYMPPTQPQQYSPRSYDYQDHQRSVRSEDQQLTQSRTFKVLESLMSSEGKLMIRLTPD